MQSTIIVAAAMAAALALTGCAADTKQTAQTQQKAATEKCFGIAKAGHNDCKAGSHNCKGQSTVDADPQSFMLLPAGTCSKLVGGTAA